MDKNKNKSKNENAEVINPLDFLDMYLEEEAEAGHLTAVKLCGDANERIILKMVLGGNIMKGTALNIAITIPDNHITFAGTEILSFEEIN